MPKTLKGPIRVNISIEEKLHEAAVKRAEDLQLQGGFSEYLARLLNRNLAGAGRDVLKMPRIYRPKPAKKAPVASQ